MPCPPSSPRLAAAASRGSWQSSFITGKVYESSQIPLLMVCSCRHPKGTSSQGLTGEVHSRPRPLWQTYRPPLLPNPEIQPLSWNRCLLMRSVGVGTQGSHLFFPARLLGSGAQRSAKHRDRSHNGGYAEQKPQGGQALETYLQPGSRKGLCPLTHSSACLKQSHWG